MSLPVYAASSRLGVDFRRLSWLWVWGLGIALYGCDGSKQASKQAAPSKEQVAACETNCEELAAAERPTCEKPVLDPQLCYKAVGYTEADCKKRCGPDQSHRE
ncbi:MAG: hypothetical protein R3B07_27275 [Polyangiaceae bacterium]